MRPNRYAQRAAANALRWLLDGRTWRKHPAPFNKTRRGAERRAARRFVRSTQHSWELAR